MIENYPNDKKYDGEYKDDMEDGEKFFYWADRDKYEGELKGVLGYRKYFAMLMEINVKENTKMAWEMIEEYLIVLMETNMRENTKIIRTVLIE